SRGVQTARRAKIELRHPAWRYVVVDFTEIRRDRDGNSGMERPQPFLFGPARTKIAALRPIGSLHVGSIQRDFSAGGFRAVGKRLDHLSCSGGRYALEHRKEVQRKHGRYHEMESTGCGRHDSSRPGTQNPSDAIVDDPTSELACSGDLRL